MTAHNSHSYLDYLDKLVDKYNNTCHCSIGEKPITSNIGQRKYLWLVLWWKLIPGHIELRIQTAKIL